MTLAEGSSMDNGVFRCGDESFEPGSVFLVNFEFFQAPDGITKADESEFHYSVALRANDPTDDVYSGNCQFRATQTISENEVGFIEANYIFAFFINLDKPPSEAFVSEYASSSIWPRFVTAARMVSSLGLVTYPRFPARPENLEWLTDSNI